MFNARTTTALAASVAAIAAGLFTGCAAPVPAQPASAPATSASPSASTAASPVGGDPGTWTPLQLDASTAGKTVEMAVGQAGLVWDNSWPGPDDAAGVTIATSDASVVTVSQPEGDDDAYSTSPALKAVAPGDAEITLRTGKPVKGKQGTTDVLVTFTVHVSARG